MTTLFATRPGIVSVLPGDGASGLIMAISGRDQELAAPGQGSYFNLRSIITQINIDEQDDFQIQKSMNVQRYAFIFGPGVGSAQIRGIAFTDVCQTADEENDLQVVGGPFGLTLTQGTPRGQTGLERICEYFSRTRVSSSGQVYNMVLGANAASRYKIMLHGMRLSLSQPAQPEYQPVEFVMSCKVFR